MMSKIREQRAIIARQLFAGMLKPTDTLMIVSSDAPSHVVSEYHWTLDDLGNFYDWTDERVIYDYPVKTVKEWVIEWFPSLAVYLEMW